MSLVHVLNLRTIIHNIVILFSANCSSIKIFFVNLLRCQMKCYSKNQILHFLCQKILLLKLLINNERSMTKIDPPIEIEPTAYYNISPNFLYVWNCMKLFGKDFFCVWKLHDEKFWSTWVDSRDKSLNMFKFRQNNQRKCKNKGSFLVAESAYISQNVQFGLLMIVSYFYFNFKTLDQCSSKHT